MPEKIFTTDNPWFEDAIAIVDPEDPYRRNYVYARRSDLISGVHVLWKDRYLNWTRPEKVKDEFEEMTNKELYEAVKEYDVKPAHHNSRQKLIEQLKSLRASDERVDEENELEDIALNE